MRDESYVKGIVSRLSIAKASREDTATFECEAKNKFGSSKRTVYLIVQVI